MRNDRVSDIVWPYWTHDKLLNALASKFRRLIVVKGTKRSGRVRYDTADLYWEPLTTLFAEAVAQGIVAIDFDARTTTGKGLRNHGTKFRIRLADLNHLYHQQRKFD